MLKTGQTSQSGVVEFVRPIYGYGAPDLIGRIGHSRMPISAEL
jgi:hypothetical protein